MRLKTLHQMWTDYRTRVIPDGAPDVQVVESRRCFYAGFYSALEEFREIGTDAVAEDQGVAHMESLWQECQAFYRLVAGGKA